MNWISQPYSFTEQAVSFCEMRAGCLTRGAGGPGGGGLGVCCHKNTTGSVGSCGASGAFLSSPQSCPLLLPVSLIQPVCLPLSCLSPCTPTTQSCACPAPTPLHWKPLCQLWEKKHSLCKENLHFTRECSLHWSRDMRIQSNAPSRLELIVTIFSAFWRLLCLMRLRQRNTSKSSIKCCGEEEKNISPWTFSKGKRGPRFTSEGFLTF